MAERAGARRHPLFWLRVRLRRNLRYVVTFAVVLVFLLVLGIWVRMYDGSSGGAVAQGGASTNDPFASLTQAAPSPAPTRPSGTAAAPTPTLPASGAPKTLPRMTITPAIPGGFTYANVPSHRLVMRVTSPGAIPGLGYLVPTSQDHSYGKVLHPGHSWSATTSVSGKPYYAAVFVQGDASGAPITCTITIDGKVASRKTTAGAFGRQVCIA